MYTEDELLDKARDLASKAEARIREGIDQVAASETFAKIKGKVNEAGDLIEKKLDELNESDISARLEKFGQELETEAERLIGEAKSRSAGMAGDIEESIEKLKEKLKGKPPGR